MLSPAVQCASRVVSSLQERIVETTVYLLAILGFGFCLYLLPPTVVELCVTIGLIGFMYQIALSMCEYRDEDLPWPLTRIPSWCFFALPVSVLVSQYLVMTNATLSQTVVLGALLAVSLYFWFILPAAWYQKLSSSSDKREQPSSSLSILVPAYNEAGYIGRCLDSLTNARYPDAKEIIVIDDGSEDTTYDEARAHATSDVVVLQQSNGGKHSALNTGLERATGEVIVTVDADSIIAENALEQIVAELEANPAVGAIAGTVKLQHTETLVEKLQVLEYAIGINTFRRAFAAVGFVNVVPGCLGCFRRAAIDDVGGYDGDTLTEDFDLTIKLLKSGWTVSASEALVYTAAPRTWTSLYKQRIR